MSEAKKKTNKSKSKDITQKFEDMLIKLYEEYTELHRKFDEYRGRKLSDPEVEKANEILFEIQDKFTNDLSPMIRYIAIRYQPSVNTIDDYEKFIEQLKNAGASEDGPIARA